MKAAPQPVVAPSASPKPIGIKGTIMDGYMVLTGPNRKNPELMDAAVIYTDVRLAELNPDVAMDIIRHAMQAAGLFD